MKAVLLLCVLGAIAVLSAAVPGLHGCSGGLCPPRCNKAGFNDWFKVGKKCFKFFHQIKPFLDAEMYCRSLSPRSHLASIHSPTENVLIYHLTLKKKCNSPGIWLGGFRFPGSLKYLWLDGSRWNYTAWAPGEPNNCSGNEHCLEMNSHRDKWNDLYCTSPRPFVCQLSLTQMETDDPSSAL
ncbi:lectin-like [Lepisosteus oculatus]|uniref:Lectin-like n=1 Tax=Lepisosteus oculatus TaxID=7918 RepID=W5LY85_LEPOC|nr:PREDICTED: lectin-like [Lepisosteus oculatus]